MQFLPDVMMRCPECRGTRYRPETLEITYRGRNIAEVLDLTAREAFVFFRHRPKVQARLRPLLDVGLDYLRLGQPASTLSGGEAQRLKLASYLATSPAALTRTASRSRTLFLLDEPTTGLHPADTLKLLDALNSLLDLGHSLDRRSSTAPRSWPAPTGSSTSAPAPAMRGAGSSLRGPPKRSPASIRPPAGSWPRP